MKNLILLLTLTTICFSFSTTAKEERGTPGAAFFREANLVRQLTLDEAWVKVQVSCGPNNIHLDDEIVVLRYRYHFPTGWYYEICSMYRHPGNENWETGSYYEKTFYSEIEFDENGCPLTSCTGCLLIILTGGGL